MKTWRWCESQTCERIYWPTDENQKYCCPPCSNNEAARRKKKRKNPDYGRPVIHFTTGRTPSEIYKETKQQLDSMRNVATTALDDKEKLRRQVDRLEARKNELLGYNQEWQEKVDQMRQEMNEQVAATQEQGRIVAELEAKIRILQDFNMNWQTIVIERNAEIRDLRRHFTSVRDLKIQRRYYPYA